eukprot:GHVN01026470.1.p1 GENE.GHVN01026470.1~~GHVN01026470.1.p1  ORF type:complete len:164 (+),score=15.00 GHVN01026470.1:38-529(+)
MHKLKRTSSLTLRFPLCPFVHHKYTSLKRTRAPLKSGSRMVDNIKKKRRPLLIHPLHTSPLTPISSVLVTDHNDMARILAAHYQSVFLIPSPCPAPLSSIPAPTFVSFPSLDSDKVIQLVHRRTGGVPDGTNSFLLRKIDEIVAPFLCDVFNYSFSTGGLVCG